MSLSGYGTLPVHDGPSDPPEPDAELVEEYHKKHVEDLVKLCNENKAAHGCGDKELTVL